MCLPPHVSYRSLIYMTAMTARGPSLTLHLTNGFKLKKKKNRKQEKNECFVKCSSLKMVNGSSGTWHGMTRALFGRACRTARTWAGSCLGF